MVGKSIKELDLRNRYNVNVVAIKPHLDRDIQSEIPVPERILSRQDNLIVVGRKIDLVRMRKELVHE